MARVFVDAVGRRRQLRSAGDHPFTPEIVASAASFGVVVPKRTSVSNLVKVFCESAVPIGCTARAPARSGVIAATKLTSCAACSVVRDFAAIDQSPPASTVRRRSPPTLLRAQPDPVARSSGEVGIIAWADRQRGRVDAEP